MNPILRKETFQNHKTKEKKEQIKPQEESNFIIKLLEEAGFERKRLAKITRETWGPKEKEGNQAVIPKDDTLTPGVLKSIANQLGLEKRASN